MENLTTTINFCARCRGEHPDATLHPFTVAVYGNDVCPVATHWTMCPTLNEPVLVLITPNQQPTATQQSLEFTMGDVVSLKSGSPDMTVLDLRKDGEVTEAKCQLWCDYTSSFIKLEYIPSACLQHNLTYLNPARLGLAPQAQS